MKVRARKKQTKQNYILKYSRTIWIVEAWSYFIMVPHGTVLNQHTEHTNVAL